MNNWRLLLLALVAVSQPIASSTERNVFDGRQCYDRHLHLISHTPNSFTDGFFHSAKTSADERRMNRNAIREIKQLDTTLSRYPAERFRKQILGSPTRLRTRHLLRNADNEKDIGRQFSERNYRNTRTERDFHQVSLQRIQRTRNTQDVRSNYETRRNSHLKIMHVDDTRETNRIIRRERSDRNIPRITRHVQTVDRRIVLPNEATESEIIESKSVTINRRIRENVIESRRSALKSNTRISNLRDNTKFRHGHLRVNFITHHPTIIQDFERQDQNPNENRATNNISIRRNLRNRMSTRSARRNSVLQSATDRSDENSIIPNYEIKRYRHSITQKRLVTRQGIRKVVLRRTDRELIINQDSEPNQRTRSIVRRDYRNGSPAAKTTRSTESTKDLSRMRIKYETKRETTTEREIVGFRNVKATRPRENVYVYQDQEHIENRSNGNWINILYTLQGIYMCGLFLHILNGNGFGKCKVR